MADTRILMQAQETYNTLCRTLDGRKWHYNKDDEKLIVDFSVRGDDLPIQFLIFVNAKSKVVNFMSRMPSKMSEDKRLDGAIATTIINFSMGLGNFDYDISTGDITFRVVAPFEDCKIEEDLFEGIIDLICFFVDKYNDKFLALNKGFISIEDFISSEN